MAELSLNLPVVGEKDTTAEPKVTTALSEIQTQFNGKVAAVNLENNAVETAKIKAEAVTGPKLGAETVRILSATKYTTKTYTKVEAEAEVEPSATRPAYVVLAGTANSALNEVAVGGIVLLPNTPSTTKALGFMVPPGQKWKAKEEVTAATLLL